MNTLIAKEFGTRTCTCDVLVRDDIFQSHRSVFLHPEHVLSFETVKHTNEQTMADCRLRTLLRYHSA